jgi:predicted homoserine dehydrogenase-like protein
MVLQPGRPPHAGPILTAVVYLAELRARAADPAPIGLVGAGRMGRGIVDQVATMVGMRVRAVADLDGDRALRAFTENGWTPGDVLLTEDHAAAADAIRAGKAVATRDPLLVPALPLEAVVEATGDPATGAQVAAASIDAGRHTVMLNVEADVVVGPLLAERARRRSVVYTLAAGDQPGAIFEMVEWARTLGFEIVCAGRGTVLFPDDHHATPETYAEIAARNRMNPKMYNEFRDGTKSQLEMVAVSNVLGMPPERRGMHEPFCRWQDLGRVFALRSDGGLLEAPGVVDMANAVAPDGRYVHEDKVFPGVFVVVTSPHPGVRSAMAALFEPGFGGTAQQWGPNWGLFRPYHLACVEVPMSVARAIVQGRPTGDAQGGPVAELIAVAKRDLWPGDELDGGGGYTVYGLSERIEVARREGLLPFGFAYEGTRVVRPVRRDEPLARADVEVDTGGPLYAMRREQDRLFDLG